MSEFMNPKFKANLGPDVVDFTLFQSADALLSPSEHRPVADLLANAERSGDGAAHLSAPRGEPPRAERFDGPVGGLDGYAGELGRRAPRYPIKPGLVSDHRRGLRRCPLCGYCAEETRSVVTTVFDQILDPDYVSGIDLWVSGNAQRALDDALDVLEARLRFFHGRHQEFRAALRSYAAIDEAMSREMAQEVRVQFEQVPGLMFQGTLVCRARIRRHRTTHPLASPAAVANTLSDLLDTLASLREVWTCGA